MYLCILKNSLVEIIKKTQTVLANPEILRLIVDTPHLASFWASCVRRTFMYLPILYNKAFRTWDSAPEKLLWETTAAKVTINWNDRDMKTCKTERHFGIAGIVRLL